jgi:hypothetical protein
LALAGVRTTKRDALVELDELDCRGGAINAETAKEDAADVADGCSGGTEKV